LILILAAAAILVFTAKNEKPRRLDERFTLRKRDKIPYGTFVAFEGIQNFFPSASVFSAMEEPGYWSEINGDSGRQAIIIISPQFFANESEMESLIAFAQAGNDVFISSGFISEDAKRLFNCGTSFFDLYDMFGDELAGQDTMEVSLANPPFPRSQIYKYPGKRFGSSFYKYDTLRSTVLGKGDVGNTNFIHLRTGSGNMYLHLAPIVFSNYFLLKDNNLAYYEDILSLIDPGVTTILWDEYYLMKTNESRRDKKKGWFRTFMQYESLRWGLLTAIFALLIYALMEMRRKQRPIPVITKPQNDSMDFVKTIGRLYYDKRDHKNLSRKMAAYFLEHVRNRYKMITSQLNEDFILQLQDKSGVQSPEIRNIVNFIKELEIADQVSDKQLAYFHKQLESFYTKS
jgi:hypothetical protein